MATWRWGAKRAIFDAPVATPANAAIWNSGTQVRGCPIFSSTPSFVPPGGLAEILKESRTDPTAKGLTLLHIRPGFLVILP